MSGNPSTSGGPRWSIAGAGAVASIGRGAKEVFDALCAGHTGRHPLRGFDSAKFRAQHAYEIDDRTGARDHPGRATSWLCAAIAEALVDAGLGEDIGGIPVLVGTGLRELRSVELWHTDGTPFAAANLHFGTALRERFGATDTHTFSNACSASLYTLGLGADLLASGEHDTVVVAGIDTITESMFGLLDRVHPVPVDAVRPFDRHRRGVLMGDGAAAVVLRREGPATAWLRAVSMNCDAFHVTAPDPSGIAAAIQDAHARADVTPSDVDLVMAHGTGTLLNDEAEVSALAKVFGEYSSRPLVTAVKSMTGHTSGSSGLLSLVVAAWALTSGRVPPTVGLTDPVDEAASFRFVTDRPATADLRIAQIDAFGFGGVNAVAIVERAA